MNKGFLTRIVICVVILGMFLFIYINKSNELTEQKLSIPKIEKEILIVQEENKRLQYIIDRFENPMHLMELVRSPEYSHLKHPLLKDVLKVQEGFALKENKVEKSEYSVDNNTSY